jgi:protein-S-isoprenylcysteine O-methyltransferase Ste14
MRRSAGSPPSRRVSELSAILARRRVPIGFAVAALVFWLAAPTPATIRVGVAIALVGEAIRIWAAGHVRKGSEVTASGPYRWTAHPLYVGSSVMGVGLAIASASVTASVLIGLYLAATLTAAVRREEKFLRDAFGDRYDRYRRGGGASREGGRGFSVAQAIANREHRALVGLVLVVLLLAWKATYNEPFWRSAGTRAVKPGG